MPDPRWPDERRNTLEAIALVCFAGLLFVIMNAMVKALTVEHNQVMIVWARYFFHVLTVALIFPHRLVDVLRTRQVAMQLGRSILLLVSTVCNFAALIWLPLADVASIIFLAPIIVAGLAIFTLRERVSPMRWLAIGAGFVGALLIVRPGAGTLNLGALLAFGCAVAYALYQISTRLVRESEPVVSLLYSGLVGMIIFSLLAPFWWEPPTPRVWLMFLLIGALGAGGHLLVIMALQRAEATRISPFTYVQLLWAMLASFLVFGDVPGWLTVLGAVIIAGSGLQLYRLDMREHRLRPAGG
ncbi:MAG TPA: DMT family transporter [Geminicoccaceae bacterium]|nr:DMT family transporter [Geminicoccaceae bacterium]